MFRFARLGVCVGLLSLAACAPRGPSPVLLTELGRADVLVRDGCHACLTEALAIYERVTAEPRAPLHARRGAFEASLLLAVRAKELGLPSDEPIARARELAARVQAASTGLADPGLMVEAADLLIGETSGLDPEVRHQRVRRLAGPPGSRAVNPHRPALDQAADSSLAAAYLAVAIDCEQVRTREAIDLDDLVARHGDLPLMRFRAGICGSPRVELLAPLRQADPRWTDTLLFEGRGEMAGRAIDLRKAAALFTEAREAFPRSTAIALALGNTERARSRFESALHGYDAVLAEVPTHREALLGRAVSLSHLMRHVEAEAAATALIDYGTWHIGDAHYWRAWNRYHLKALEPAWADAELAIGLMVNTSAYTLSGLIAYGRKERDTALDRFTRAFDLDNDNCDAALYAGLVHAERHEWRQASPRFSVATTCFTSAVERDRTELDRLAASERHPEDKDPEMARLRASIEANERHAAQSAYNAALACVQMGETHAALSHLERARRHPAMTEKADALKKAIEDQPR
jgi:tetratricopeptide (TPR) repeat protein